MKTKVKFCGMTRQQDILAAEELGADFIGFIFVPSSPRCISVDQAEHIRGAIKQAKVVGVFADYPYEEIGSVRILVEKSGHTTPSPVLRHPSPSCVAHEGEGRVRVVREVAYRHHGSAPTLTSILSLPARRREGEEALLYLPLKGSDGKLPAPQEFLLIQEIEKYAEKLHLDFIQLHGKPDIDRIKNLSKPVIQAFSGVPDLRTVEAFLKLCPFILIDKADGEDEADFDAIAALPFSIREKLFLAGGLTPGNVRMAVDRIEPYAVDCARGIESQPGHKNHHRMLAFSHALS